MGIRITGARTNSLRGISAEIREAESTVLTGLSGSGKSSLAVETIANEGRRQYLEALALTTTLPRADVDLIEGLSPVLPIHGQPRRLIPLSTLSGCRELLEVLFMHLGEMHSPTTGQKLDRKSRPEIVEEVLNHFDGERIRLLAHIKGSILQRGFVRLFKDGQEIDLTDEPGKGDVIVDRLAIKPGIRERLADSIRLALEVGHGILQIECEGKLTTYATVYVDPTTKEIFPTKQLAHCRLHGQTLAEIEALPISDFPTWPQTDPLSKEIIPRLKERIDALTRLGLSYLSLDRQELSIGEAGRAQLASQIGHKLHGITYVLDEPSRGLHKKDIQGLLDTFDTLKKRGNTLIIVDHSPEVISAADHIIELGPGAGKHGGRIIYEGDYKGLLKSDTPTGRWLSGREKMPAKTKVHKPTSFIHLKNASARNIHNLTLDVPLGCLIAFAGPSGSGKSTLVFDLLKPEGILIDQKTAGTSLTSTAATYTGIMTPLRKLLSQTTLARARGYTPSYFSKQGTCQACKGIGETRIKTDFLPTMWQPCNLCRGKRYNEDALQCLWNGLSLADILSLPVEEALPLFSAIPDISRRLLLMQELGLEYLELGQRATTLSGGEMQRLKLIAQLAKKGQQPTLYVLDEPSTGLHLHDLEKLIRILHKLVEAGHTVWMIEHNEALLAQADWLIELGPGAGPQGGQILHNKQVIV